jgi:uncharacterized membrane protein YccC
MKTLVAIVGVGVAWLTYRDRNPVRWPRLVRDEATQAAQDVREALVDGARAGRRAEKAFDDDVAAVRAAARRW